MLTERGIKVLDTELVESLKDEQLSEIVSSLTGGVTLAEVLMLVHVYEEKKIPANVTESVCNTAYKYADEIRMCSKNWNDMLKLMPVSAIELKNVHAKNIVDYISMSNTSNIFEYVNLKKNNLIAASIAAVTDLGLA